MPRTWTRPEPLCPEQTHDFVESLEHCTKYSVPVRRLLANRARENLLVGLRTMACIELGDAVQRCLAKFGKRLQSAGHGELTLHPTPEAISAPDGAREGMAWSLALRDAHRAPLRIVTRLLAQLDADRRVRLSVDLSVKTEAGSQADETDTLLTAVASMPLSTSARDARDVLAACAIISQDLERFHERFVALELELDAVLAH